MISAVALELRDTLDTEALQELQEFLAETMDRHAAHTARDDRESSNSTPHTKAAGLKNQKRNNSKHETRRQDFEARIGALQGERGDKTDGLSHKRAEAIHDSSPKANAQKDAQ